MENPPKKYFRLQPGGEVRLKFSYIIKCEEVVKDENGNIVEIRCSYDPESRPGNGQWRSVKGTIHWLSTHVVKKAEIRLLDRLFLKAEMDSLEEGEDYKTYLNPESLKSVEGYIDEHILDDKSGTAVQFERLGYFIQDADSTPEKPVFNRTVGLKSAW